MSMRTNKQYWQDCSEILVCLFFIFSSYLSSFHFFFTIIIIKFVMAAQVWLTCAEGLFVVTLIVGLVGALHQEKLQPIKWRTQETKKKT